MTRSVSLGRNDKFEMGRYFFKSFESRFGFLRRGFTKADLNSFRKVPELRDKFTIRVTIGKILSIQWGKRLEGIGSDGQVNFDEDNINCSISSKDSGLNEENIGGDLLGTENEFILINGRFKRRVLILWSWIDRLNVLQEKLFEMGLIDAKLYLWNTRNLESKLLSNKGKK